MTALRMPVCKSMSTSCGGERRWAIVSHSPQRAAQFPRSLLSMRSLCSLLLLAGAAVAQPVSVGIKAGLPLTDLLDTGGSMSTNEVTNRYLIGLEVEVRLPLRLSVEFDALYRHFRYTNVVGGEGPFASYVTTVGNSGNWEFPLVVKYRLRGKLMRPYVEAGAAWDALSGLKNTAIQTPCSSYAGYHCQTFAPPAVEHWRAAGAVLGAGLDLHWKVVHVAPEIRFTHWARRYIGLDDVLRSSRNQVEFLVGITH